MARDNVGKLRDDLDTAKSDLDDLRLALAEAAQKETEQTRIIQRQQREMHELKNQLEAERLRLEGFQLELQTRHYELPFILANVEALLGGAIWPANVNSLLLMVQNSLKNIIDDVGNNKPTLDPRSWVALSKKLGLALNFNTRRTPVLHSAASQD